MFYISSFKNGMYGITDSDDNIEEFFSKDDIKDFILNKGFSIYGAKVIRGNIEIKVVEHEKSAVEMAKRLLIDSIWKSARVEGLGTTFPKTEAILRGLPTDHTDSNEVMFILNMKEAWKFLLETLNEPNRLNYLRQLNKICGYSLFYGCGEIRKSMVTIGGTSWVPDIPFEGDIVDRLSEIDSISDRELCALKMFCYVARTHMFIDGNKRVAQLMANKVLLQANIGIFQIPVEQNERFKTLLLRYYETDDDTRIMEFLHRYCVIRR